MRFSDRTTGDVTKFCPGAEIIHIDIDSSEIGKNIVPHVPIVADAKRALKALYNRLVKSYRKQEDLVRSVKGLSPSRLLIELRKIIPRDAIITTEVGQNQMWAALYMKTYKPRTFISSGGLGTFISSGGLGTMGFGFPAAISGLSRCSSDRHRG